MTTNTFPSIRSDAVIADPPPALNDPDDPPLLLFGGPYSNLEATRALLALAERLNLPPGRMICTGDVVAYGPDPAETVALIRQAGVTVILGNCEEAFGWSQPNCGCGFADGTACDRLSGAWYAYADGRLAAEDRAWMRALPRQLDIRVAGHRRVTVVHGAPRHINRFVFASDPWADKAAAIRAIGSAGIIAGHSGLPFTQTADGLLWHNAGAIGLPANDGTPRVWYSLLSRQGDGIRIRLRALDYDFATTARKMRAAGLPRGYADALETGLWPSLDILPPPEAAATGHPLVERDEVWTGAARET